MIVEVVAVDDLSGVKTEYVVSHAVEVIVVQLGSSGSSSPSSPSPGGGGPDAGTVPPGVSGSTVTPDITPQPEDGQRMMRTHEVSHSGPVHFQAGVGSASSSLTLVAE